MSNVNVLNSSTFSLRLPRQKPNLACYLQFESRRERLKAPPVSAKLNNFTYLFPKLKQIFITPKETAESKVFQPQKFHKIWKNFQKVPRVVVNVQRSRYVFNVFEVELAEI
jgi:hypothetical protein